MLNVFFFLLVYVFVLTMKIFIWIIYRYLAQNFDWLHEQLEDVEDDYILFDCPGKFFFIPFHRELLVRVRSMELRLVFAWDFTPISIYFLSIFLILLETKKLLALANSIKPGQPVHPCILAGSMLLAGKL